jgi:hypothetical protein
MCTSFSAALAFLGSTSSAKASGGAQWPKRSDASRLLQVETRLADVADERRKTKHCVAPGREFAGEIDDAREYPAMD